MAAVVKGCSLFDPSVRIGGVVLNRIAGARHESILRRSIEEHCGIPVMGAIPKLRRQCFPERHMGLVPTHEHDWARTSIDYAARIVQDHLDLETIAQMACETDYRPPPSTLAETPPAVSSRPTIGVIQDSAFQFYYPENIEALRFAGAQLIFFSPLEVDRIPDIDGLYIGGGFPETHAEALARNETFRLDLKNLAEAGLPIYAECGGLMYLGQELVLDQGRFPMAGILPVVFGFARRPQGHGYTIIEVSGDNPYFPTGTTLRGHEFHYSSVLAWDGAEEDLAYTMVRGTGLINGRDGLCYKNVLATYTHLHAQGTPDWAPALVRNALQFRQSQTSPA
jgi:cobyrinic acid a,c-diamide synthase